MIGLGRCIYCKTLLEEVDKLEKENRRLQKLVIDAVAYNERLLEVNAEYKWQAIKYAHELELIKENE